MMKIAIKELLEKRIIEKLTSPWSSAPAMVRKSDEGTRFCIDYRNLNHGTKMDAYPIPFMESI